MKVTKIIKYSATWCHPCRLFAETFHKVSNMEEFKDIRFSEVDIEKDEDENIYKYRIESIPTTLIFGEGDDNLIYRLIGNVSEKDFVNTINSAKELKDE